MTQRPPPIRARPRERRLTDQDRADWATFARLIAGLPGRTVPGMPSEPPTPPPPQPVAPRPAPASPVARPVVALAVGTQPGGLDNATWNRFRSGKLAPARTLDLHGRTAQRAFHALHAFLHAAHADHVRCVEVITGRGSGETGGVLRREVPLWLNLPALRPLVLAASHPHAANPGSVRLLLRRPK
jgi:DNA-nicking Smr family endonuclease